MNIQTTENKIPAHFPVSRIVVDHGLAKTRVLNHGDVVKCWWCGKKIRLNAENTFTVPDEPSGMTYVECHKCKKRMAVLYIFDRVVKKIVRDK